MKNRKQKQIEYQSKFSDIPRDYNERIRYMIDKYNVSPKQMEQIIYRKMNIERNLQFYEHLLILYEVPEGTPRPRFRIITKSNYMQEALSNPNFVHVYQPNANDDGVFMRRLVGQDLLNLDHLIQTPCTVNINCYFEIPSTYSISDKFIAEYGLDWSIKKPDWDNIGKKYSDMYNANVWLDDNMVISGTVNKFYSILPRVEIYLRYLNVASTRKQYNTIITRKNYDPLYPISYLDTNGNIQKGDFIQ